LEVLAFFRDQSILRSGLQPWSFHPSSSGLRWLSKLVFSSLPANGLMLIWESSPASSQSLICCAGAMFDGKPLKADRARSSSLS